MKVKALAALVSIAGAAIPAFAEEITVKFDPTQTRVNFTLSDVLHTVHGVFRLKSGDMQFDAATGKATGQLVVDAASGNSGSDARDSRMHKNILESSKYPEITFRPDHIEGNVNLEGDSQVQVHGAFAIHGADHELILPIQVHASHQQVTASTHFSVPYVKWRMKNPSTFLLRVSDQVQIEIQAAGRITTSS